MGSHGGQLFEHYPNISDLHLKWVDQYLTGKIVATANKTRKNLPPQELYQ